MTEVFAGAENIITSLGFDIDENISNILSDKTGIEIDSSGVFSPFNLPLSLVNHDKLEELFAGINTGMHHADNFTLLEKMFIVSITDALLKCRINISSPDTLIIITTTKGNIDLLDPLLQNKFGRKRLFLSGLSKFIAGYFKNPNMPLIVSNACISGVLGLVYGERLIRSGKYKNVVVAGGDRLSEFIVSGFHSFQSLSMMSCRPFDKSHDGLTLGEGCGTIILSSDHNSFQDENPIMVLAGAGSNDANHISGPSRTGEGLLLAIQHALEFSGVLPEEIDTISAHGTATDYNDEMESIAFSSAGMESVHLNSYKGYIGHTLGAAGVIEAALSLQSMKRNLLFRSAGYENHGVSKNINVIRNSEKKEINICLKTASGFGGSNAAIVFHKQ